MARRWITVCVCTYLAVMAGHRTSSPARTSQPVSRQSALKQFKATPLAFEANVGQTDGAASFVARGQGYTMWATADGPLLRLVKPGGGAVVKLRVVGGTPQGHPSAEVLLPGRANYFLGNEPTLWKTDVKRYGALRYSDVYPGVDLVLHGTQESLEYDFAVAPHSDPSRVAVSFDGATSVRLEASGDLTLTVNGGEMGFRPPVAYQERNGERELVAARYELDVDNVVRFALGKYDETRLLTIDPVLSYSSYLGGTLGNFGLAGNDAAYALAVDVFGNAYLAGFTNALNFPLPGAAYDSACAGCTNSGGDAWVAKIDPSQSGAASLVFATYLGAGGAGGSGTGSSYAYGVAADSAGNVYVTGGTAAFDNGSAPSKAFPTTLGAFQTSSGGGLDAYLTKLNPTGSSLLYSTYIGGNNTDEGASVKVDNVGHAYVAGWAASSDFHEILNGFKTTNPVIGFDGFVVKFDTTKTGAAALQYGTLVGGHSQDRIGAMAVDAAGHVYVTGMTQSSTFTPPSIPFPVLNGFQMATLGGQDSFMTMIDPAKVGAASLLYSTLISSSGTEDGAQQDAGIAVDSNGIVYVAGMTDGGSGAGVFPTTLGAIKSTAQNGDPYIVKIDPSQAGASSLLASTLVGGGGQESATGLAIDQNNNPVLVGSTSSSDIQKTACALPKLNGVDGFVMVLDPSLTSLKFGTPLSGFGTEHIYGVAIGPLGQIYLAGETQSTDFPITGDSATSKAAHDATLGGSQDAFLTVIASPLDSCAAPVAAGLTTTVSKNTPKALTLTATDADGNKITPDGITWKVTTGPSHGTLDVLAGAMAHDSGTNYSVPVSYSPAANYTGSDSFQFRVNDGWLNSNIATVTINVTAPPIANAQNVTTTEETPKSITLTGSDPDNNLPLTFTVSTGPAHGALNPPVTGAVRTYTPAANFYGQDSFTFYVSDSLGAQSALATVTIDVTNVNDSPVATADSTTTPEDAPVTVAVLANDTDADSDTMAVTAPSCNQGAGVAVNADNTITVTPAANFNGTILCSYTVNDGHGGSSTTSLTVTVTPANDTPTAGADAVSTPEDMAVTVNVLANDSDLDGDSLTIVAPSCNNGAGVQVNADNTLAVNPATNFNGTVTCSYTADDGHGGTATGQLLVSVTPVNDNPIAAPDTASTDDNTLIIVPVLANDGDPDGNVVALDAVGACQYGELTQNADGTVTYKPKAGFGGIDVCSYTVIDNQGGAASGQLSVTVTKVNDAPSLENPGDQQSQEGDSVSLPVTSSDPDGDTLTFSATGLPAGVSIDPTTGLISGTPAAGSAGSHEVKVTADDGNGGIKTVTLTWLVTPPSPNNVNVPPVCSAAYPSVTSIWPPDHQLVPIQVFGVTDADGGQPGITITRILQDEPTNTFGDGNTWIDGFGVGTSLARIRAERSGTPKVPGNGRVYEIVFTATDTLGATCTGSVLVGVPHDQSHGPAVDSLVRYDSTVTGGQPINKP